jgi:hypothetical protein
MIGFLNERSLEEHSDWQRALGVFLLVVQELRLSQAELFRDSRFFLSGDFKRRFHSIGFPKDQRAVVQGLVFTDQYCRCWTSERVSSAENAYSCLNPPIELKDDSVCEAAENKVAHGAAPVVLVSAIDSRFGNQDPVGVTKADWDGAVELRNATSLAAIKEYIAQQRGYYDPASRVSPRDFQTVLAKMPERFRRIGKVERRFSRQVFEETASGQLYYVDDVHPGQSAHLEVFSAAGEHLGVADINAGALDVSGKVEGRRLRL